MEILELKTTITKILKSLGRLNNRREMIEESTNFQKSLEIIQIEQQREIRLGKHKITVPLFNQWGLRFN